MIFAKQTVDSFGADGTFFRLDSSSLSASRVRFAYMRSGMFFLNTFEK